MSTIAQRSILRSHLKSLSKQFDNLAKSELLNEQMIQLNEFIQTIECYLIKLKVKPQSKESCKAQVQQTEAIKKLLGLARPLLIMLTNQSQDNVHDLLMIVGFLMDEAFDMMNSLEKNLLDQYCIFYQTTAPEM